MGRDQNTQSGMRTLSGALSAHFCFFFSLSFLTSICSPFRRGFERVLGDQNYPEIDFFGIFWICLWRFYFYSNFARFLIESMAKNIEMFSGFSVRCFINCCLNLLISSMHVT